VSRHRDAYVTLGQLAQVTDEGGQQAQLLSLPHQAQSHHTRRAVLLVPAPFPKEMGCPKRKGHSCIGQAKQQAQPGAR
jgi:hypothetical protein